MRHSFPVFLALVGYLAQKGGRVSKAQSIGYYPHLNLGFNPYLSPVFGYGLGIQYGANGISPFRDPLFASSIPGYSYHKASPTGLLGKVHAKTFLKHLPTKTAPDFFKNKLALLKHPEITSPYLYNYGFGKHYGSALVPNNPYKSAYGDYYGSETSPIASITDPKHNFQRPLEQSVVHPVPSVGFKADKIYSILKPILKTGAFLSAAALLGKKALETPVKLHPAGMILNSDHIQ